MPDLSMQIEISWYIKFQLGPKNTGKLTDRGIGVLKILDGEMKAR